MHCFHEELEITHDDARQISGVEKLSQEDHEFKVSLRNLVRHLRRVLGTQLSDRSRVGEVSGSIPSTTKEKANL